MLAQEAECWQTKRQGGGTEKFHNVNFLGGWGGRVTRDTAKWLACVRENHRDPSEQVGS